MKKPKPRTTDQLDGFLLDCMCRCWAEAHYDNLVKVHEAAGLGYGTREELAEVAKELVQSGQLQIHFDKARDGFRLVPGINTPALGTA
jgi:hypothetical protein